MIISYFILSYVGIPKFSEYSLEKPSLIGFKILTEKFKEFYILYFGFILDTFKCSFSKFVIWFKYFPLI